MLLLIGIAAIRGHGDFDPTRPLTWVFVVGLTVLALGSAVVYLRMEHSATRAGRAVRERR